MRAPRLSPVLCFGRAAPLGRQIPPKFHPFEFTTEFRRGIGQVCAALAGMIAMREAPGFGVCCSGPGGRLGLLCHGRGLGGERGCAGRARGRGCELHSSWGNGRKQQTALLIPEGTDQGRGTGSRAEVDCKPGAVCSWKCLCFHPIFGRSVSKPNTSPSVS